MSCSKQDVLMVSLSHFFSNKWRIQQMLKITEGRSPISLRDLDWFATNYSKKLNTNYNIYLIDNDKEIMVLDEDPLPIGAKHLRKFFVHLDYKSQLKAYSKKQFDPFCRRRRIAFVDAESNQIETTVGQLNFFRWCIENHIIEYVERNLKTIADDMKRCIKSVYKKTVGESDSDTGERRKRQELSISATKTISKHNVNITVRFD